MTGLLMTYGLGWSLAFAESGLGLGMVMPGETAVVVLAAATPTLGASLGLFAAVALGACCGDHLGYAIGRRYHHRLRDARMVRRLGVERYDRAVSLMRRRGAIAVFLTRLVPVIRTLTPAVAGASGVRYRAFATASLAGSLLWSGVYVAGGSLLAAGLAAAGTLFGHAGWLLVVLVAVVVLPPLAVRRGAGPRPVTRHPDLAGYELDRPAPRRREAFSPLIGDVQW